ncbi:MAG: hypothetical protein PF484_12465 [Bacteroidales bacterium]|jgi:hypothetical protein|nr:hypothetical protein [Bacteroidales bacterium]
MKFLRLLILGITILGFFASCETQNEAREENRVEVYSPDIVIDVLSDSVNETSGLIFYKGSIWTLNDSGGEAEIYSLDKKTGKIIQTIGFKDVQNFDFESLAQDDDFIYVGDIGNNFGNRQDLSIYKIAKKDIPEIQDTILPVERIQFNFSDQYSFIIRPRFHDFDCEALISYRDYLYVFTKNWADLNTRFYAIPKVAGEYTIDVLGEFNADGLITGADYKAENNMLSLLGYKDFLPFIWIFTEFEGNNFFEGKSRRFNLDSIHGAQTEGICFNDKGDLLISSENSYFNQRLYGIPAHVLTSKKNTYKYEIQKPLLLELEYLAEKDHIILKIKGLIKGSYTVEILNQDWILLDEFSYSSKGGKEQIILSTKNLITGMHYIRVKQNKKLQVSRVYLNK